MFVLTLIDRHYTGLDVGRTLNESTKPFTPLGTGEMRYVSRVSRRKSYKNGDYYGRGNRSSLHRLCSRTPM